MGFGALVNSKVSNCIDSFKDLIGKKCALDDDADRQKLWDLSSLWVRNYLAPLSV